MKLRPRDLIHRRPILTRAYRGIPLLVGSRKSKLIAAVKPYTLMQRAKLSAVYDLALRLEREQKPGSFVECGVLNGGSAALLASVARHNPRRQVWLFDSWEGLPEPAAVDVSTITGRPGYKGYRLGSLETVRWLLFTKLGLDERLIALLKGWFNETLPRSKREIGQIAFLLLDCNLYESYKVCLEELYDSVIPGGVIFIDDYGSWEGCRKATDEFIQERKLNVTMIDVWTDRPRSNRAVYFRKVDS